MHKLPRNCIHTHMDSGNVCLWVCEGKQPIPPYLLRAWLRLVSCAHLCFVTLICKQTFPILSTGNIQLSVCCFLLVCFSTFLLLSIFAQRNSRGLSFFLLAFASLFIWPVFSVLFIFFFVFIFCYCMFLFCLVLTVVIVCGCCIDINSGEFVEISCLKSYLRKNKRFTK